MRMLASSSSRVLVGNLTEPRLSSWPIDFHSRPENLVPGPSYERGFHLRVLHSFVASRRRPIHPISFQSSCLSPNCQANLDTAGTLIQDLSAPGSDETLTVRVRFKLQKECLFGQRFLVVGDDPVFGLWDLSRAIPMDWSDGHIWSVEMDVPVWKSIHFKFILEERAGKIFWQPGPDRFFQTRETKNVVTVIEDWENPELQQIVEEESYLIQNVTHSQKELTSCKSMTETGNELITVTENVSPSQEKHMAMVAENITDTDKPIAIPNNDTASDYNISGMDDGRMTSVKDPESEIIAVAEHEVANEVPVLVPGLTLSAMVLNEEAPSKKDEKITPPNVSISTNGCENNDDVCKLDEKQPDSFQQEIADISWNEAIQHGSELKDQHALVTEQYQNDLKQSTQNVLHGDIKWGRKTLQDVLTMLGFIK